MKLRLCLYPGCSLLTSNGGYCETHKALASKKRQERKEVFTRREQSGEYHKLYYSPRWRAMRKDFLKKYPYCFVCGAKATIADHIQPHKGNIELFYNESNLQPMCWSCHTKKTFAENNFFKKR